MLHTPQIHKKTIETTTTTMPREEDDYCLTSQRVDSFKAMVASISSAAHPDNSDSGVIPLARHPKLTDHATLYKPRNRAGTSSLDKHGVRVRDVRLDKEGNEQPVLKWFCLVGDCANGADGHCKTSINFTEKTTNHASNHLKNAHQILSTKTASYEENVRRLNQVIQRASLGYKKDPSRFYFLNFGTWAALHNVPFAAFTGDAWNTIASHLPAGNGSSLLNLDVRRAQVEQYVHLKGIVVAELNEAKNRFRGLPFLCLNLDLYQNKISGDKYIGLRVSWSWSGKLFSRNLSMRWYNPSFADKENVKDATELLYKWSMGVLAEFGIVEQEHIFTSSGDGGSDVKKLMQKSIKAMREWCISHLLNVAMVDAFGTNPHLKYCKNREG